MAFAPKTRAVLGRAPAAVVSAQDEPLIELDDQLASTERTAKASAQWLWSVAYDNLDVRMVPFYLSHDLLKPLGSVALWPAVKTHCAPSQRTSGVPVGCGLVLICGSQSAFPPKCITGEFDLGVQHANTQRNARAWDGARPTWARPTREHRSPKARVPLD